MSQRRPLQVRVVAAAEAASARQKFVTPIERQSAPPDLVIGRSAAGRALDEQAIMLAVVASIRHEDTSYDDLLMSGVGREEARERVRPAIERVLAAWSKGDTSVPAVGGPLQ